MDKKKRKFRAMTNAEFCKRRAHCIFCPEYNMYSHICGINNQKDGLYKTKDGKYILIEVKE